MRKATIFSLSIVAFLGLSAVASAADPTIAGWDNKSKFAQQAGRGGSRPAIVLKWVRLANTGINATSVVSGDALIYDIVSSDDGVTVRRTTTSGDAAFAGIAVTAIPTADTASTSDVQSDIGKGNWGWIVVHGPVMANVTAGGTNGNAAGDLFITSTDSATITGMQDARVSGDNAAAAASNTNLTRTIRNAAAAGGFFLDAASGSATAVEVFVENE